MRAEELLRAELRDWPAGAAVAVVRPGGVVALSGPSTPQAWASVTKVVSSIAVLAEVARGALDLDAAAGPPGATLRHLLAHASGLAFVDEEVLDPPGSRRRYSNAGYDVVTRHVTERLGVDLPTLVTRTWGRVADTPTFRPGPSAATGASGTIADLAGFVSELLEPRSVPEGVVRRAAAVAFEDLDGEVPGWGEQWPNDWGLGPEVRGTKSHWMPEVLSPATFGHFGMAGSFFWVDPERRLGLAGLSPRPFGAWAKRVWPRLGRQVVAAADEGGLG